MFSKIYLLPLFILLLISCTKENFRPETQSVNEQEASSRSARAVAYTSWIVGSAADVSPVTQYGIVLMGGGTDVDAAMKWMIARCGGGDFVVIRASGSDGYNSYLYGLGTVNSVETILINSATIANDPAVEAKIRNAEALFIAGGDQYNYVSYWKDTKVESAINYLINTKKAPVGGTSAGCAILGKAYFDARNGSVYSDEALENPYNRYISLQRDNFLNVANLSNTITDTHFSQRDRLGRLITFMALMSKDWAVVPKGIGVDEATAVCLDESGNGKVFGSNKVYFLRQNASGPERCVSGSSLDWYRNQQAVKAYLVPGTSTGTNSFNVSTWTGTGDSSTYYYVDRGILY